MIVNICFAQCSNSHPCCGSTAVRDIVNDVILHHLKGWPLVTLRCSVKWLLVTSLYYAFAETDIEFDFVLMTCAYSHQYT